ncbi:MAG: GntR family transcriptional regulator, partial [Spirochaetes bacterium]
METVDKASPIPVYLQLAEILEKRIKDSLYRVGSKIPPESRLS